MSPATLSQIISGKRPLTRKSALLIIEKCALSPEDTKLFLSSCLGEKWQETLKQSELFFDAPHLEELEIEKFRSIASWQHYAILSLGELPGNSRSPAWIADQLSISQKEAHVAFTRLMRLGLIKIKGKGFYQSSVPHSVPTRGFEIALRKYHQQNLQKAEESLLSNHPILELFSATTMAVNESNLPKARELIRKFRLKLCQLLEQGKKERVYTLSMQLIPISKKKDCTNAKQN